MSTRVAYENAGWYMMRQIKQRSCPAPEKAEQLEKDVGALMRWHRKNELPRYVTGLRKVAARLDAPLDVRGVDELLGVFDGAWQRLRVRLLKGALKYVEVLSEGERKCMRESAEREWKDKEKELKKPADEYVEEKLDTRWERLEAWVGELTHAQKKALVGVVGVDKVRDEALHAVQVSAGRRLLGKLTSGDVATRLGLIRGLIKDQLGHYEGGERQAIEASWERFRELVRALGTTLNAEQRAHLKERLLDYAREFEALQKG